MTAELSEEERADVYRDGAIAALDGRARSTNPYHLQTRERYVWFDGFTDARRDMKVLYEKYNTPPKARR